MAGKVVIVGSGTTGFQIAKQLIADGKDVILVERDPETAKYAMNHLDCLVLNESGNNLPALRSAGVAGAEFFISVTESDEFNMVACGLVSREFSVPVKIARVRSPEYAGSHVFDGSFLDIDYFVNPEIEASQAIVRAIESGATSDIIVLEGTELEMRNIVVDEGSFMRDRRVEEVRQESTESFLVAGISRGDEFFIPGGDSDVRLNDEVYLVASKEVLDTLFVRAGRPKIMLRSIIIVGGGRVGSFVARSLLENRRRVRALAKLLKYLSGRRETLKIIESDYETCKVLSQRFPEAVVINSDISEEGFFEEEGLSGHDVIITTTNNSEMNILVAMYAKSFGIKRSVALVNKHNYLSLAAGLGVDVVISPKNSVVNAVLKFIRRGRIRSVHSLFGGQAEVVETTIESSAALEGRKLRDLKMPRNALVICVRRDSSAVIPDGNFVLHNKDRLTIIARTESIARMEELFKG